MGLDSTLRKARETYGSKNQILVSIEELNELACVLAKFPRYDSEEKARKELHDKVLDEVADVYIILEHVTSIMKLPEREIAERVKEKINRLERWLSNSSSMQETVDDRVVKSSECKLCENYENPDYMKCDTCIKTEAVEGHKPFFKEKTNDTEGI